MPDSVAGILGLLSAAMPSAGGRAGGLAAEFARRLAATTTEEERREFLRLHAECGRTWGYQPGHRVARIVTVMLAEGLLGARGTLQGVEHCRRALELAGSGTPVVMTGNHLSYGDTSYLLVLLEKAGLPAYPLLVMAGPKVYQDPFRRLMVMAFDSLRLAQPPSRASEQAAVPPRELALITRQVMKDAAAWQDRGRVLYIFPEGSRTRSGGLERLIPAAARYLEREGSIVFPVGFVGTDGLMGVAGAHISAAEIAVRVGRGVGLDALGAGLEGMLEGARRQYLMDRLGGLMAALLPEGMRGVYGPQPQGVADEPLEKARDWYLTAGKSLVD